MAQINENHVGVCTSCEKKVYRDKFLKCTQKIIIFNELQENMEVPNP